MIEEVKTLAISATPTLTESVRISNTKRVTFSVDGTAATYTVQISLNGTDYVDFDAGTAVSLNTYTVIEAKDLNAKFIRLKSSVATTAVVEYLKQSE